MARTWLEEKDALGLTLPITTHGRVTIPLEEPLLVVTCLGCSQPVMQFHFEKHSLACAARMLAPSFAKVAKKIVAVAKPVSQTIKKGMICTQSPFSSSRNSPSLTSY